MVKKTRGIGAAKKLKEKHRKFKYSKKGSKSKFKEGWKKFDPIGGSPQARGIVLEKVQIECKQPHSGLRKCVKVQLIKNGKVVTAFAPEEGAIKNINEHDEVVIQRIGAPQRGAKGDIPGVKFAVIKVANVSLHDILKGKRQKPTR
jgi:small subunit ribosomal protein S12